VEPAITWSCAACGAPADPAAPAPFRCVNAGGDDDVDHLLVRRVRGQPRFAYDEPNPFLRHRELLTAWDALRAGGRDDAEFVAMVRDLDRAIAAVDGHGFLPTPFRRAMALSERLGFSPAGGVWIKDETGNVGGSHKARHLMAVILELEAMERLGRLPPRPGAPPLAIASCGNAALAGAVLARAARRPLLVFVPEAADEGVVARLRELGADVRVCARRPGIHGDPAFAAFRDAVAGGAIPFSCQGPECALAIEGGQTLAWEMIAPPGEGPPGLDRIFVQVGGGALASACAHAYREANALGVRVTSPRIHAVQSTAVAPLARAYAGVRAHVLRAAERQAPGVPTAFAGLALGAPVTPTVDAAAADWLRDEARAGVVREALHEAARHRSAYMWPWEQVPARAAAAGILDDETYDWHAVVAAMLASGGFPVVVDEAEISNAHAHAVATTGIHADPTGTAGLAGLVDLRRRGVVDAAERVAVLFTGAERAWNSG
jgi:threonine synthase